MACKPAIFLAQQVLGGSVPNVLDTVWAPTCVASARRRSLRAETSCIPASYATMVWLTQISRPRDARPPTESESGLRAGAATRFQSRGPDRRRGGSEARLDRLPGRTRPSRTTPSTPTNGVISDGRRAKAPRPGCPATHSLIVEAHERRSHAAADQDVQSRFARRLITSHGSRGSTVTTECHSGPRSGCAMSPHSDADT